MLTEGPFNDVSREVIGAAIEVHQHLGPGLLESTYMPCLLHELHARQLEFVTQRLVPVRYKSLPLEAHYRIDLMVKNLVIELTDGIKRLLNTRV